MATTPQFAGTINVGLAAVSATADTAVATSGSAITPTAASFVTLLTAGASGSKVEEVTYTGTGTTVASLIRLYIYTGSVYYLYDTAVITVVANSTTAAPFRLTVTYTNLELKSGETLVVSSTVASQLINVVAIGGDL
jgi:hypothetical protein